LVTFPQVICEPEGLEFREAWGGNAAVWSEDFGRVLMKAIRHSVERFLDNKKANHCTWKILNPV